MKMLKIKPRRCDIKYWNNITLSGLDNSCRSHKVRPLNNCSIITMQKGSDYAVMLFFIICKNKFLYGMNFSSLSFSSASLLSSVLIFRSFKFRIFRNFLKYRIVIVDEPQNMETDIRKKAISNLNPLCTLRYSATHTNLYNLIYRLDPVKAYDLWLVKQIEVDSVYTMYGNNQAFINIESITELKSCLLSS